MYEMMSIAMKNEIKKAAFRELQRKTMFSETAASNSVLENKYQALMKNIWAQRRQDYLIKVQTERRPEQLTRDVVSRMYKSGLTEKEWKKAGSSERLDMLQKAADIMAQEMLLPQDIRSQLEVCAKKLPDDTGGETNRFISIKDGDRAVAVKKPVIEINKVKLQKASCTEAYSTLFHEMNHVMQQVSITESSPWTENVEYWRDNLQNYADGDSGYIDYVTGSLEAYAHAQQALFEKVYNAQKYEPIQPSSHLNIKEAKAASFYVHQG